MINFPKTGSTFVRTVLKKIYEPSPTRILLSKIGFDGEESLDELLLPEINARSTLGLVGPHGTYRQIPSEHANKPVVTVTRNPLARYVSLYKFGFWKTAAPGPIEEIKKSFPSYPGMSFREYMEMINSFGSRDRLGDIRLMRELGVHSIQLIQYYYPDPNSILPCVDDDYMAREGFKEELPDIRFLRQEHLNTDLHEFLLEMGLPDERISFVLEEPRIHVTRGHGEQIPWREYYDSYLIDTVVGLDRLVFEMFPEYLEEIS
jgi:hypothetical protein